MEYLVTDTRTNAKVWIAANTPAHAVRLHAEQERPELHDAKVSSYSDGAVIDVSLADSAIRGRRENVTRA